MGPEIRRLTIDNFDDIVRVWADAGLPTRPRGRDSREMIAVEMKHPTSAYFGLFLDDRMIGVAIASFDGRRGWVNRMAIDPDFRGQGFASRMIAACEDFLHEVGALVICALIEELNGPSMSCFEKAGYHAEKEIIYWAKRPSPDA